MTQKQQQRLLPLFLFYQAWSRVRFREDSELNTFKYSQLEKMQWASEKRARGPHVSVRAPLSEENQQQEEGL